MNNLRLRFLTLALGAVALPCAHASLVDGNLIDITVNYPNSTQLFHDFGTFAVGTSGSLGGLAGVSLTPTQISVTDDVAQYFQPSSFDGLKFTDMSGDPEITGVTLDPSSSPIGETVSFDSSQVFVNFSGLTLEPGQTFVLDLQFASPASVTPEPSSIALMGTGLFGLAGVMRRRFKHA